MRRVYIKLLIKCFLVLLTSFPLIAQDQVGSGATQTAVTFKAEDGWTIHATYYTPFSISDSEIPGVVIVSEPDITPGFIAGKLADEMAVLLINVRGTAASLGEKSYEDFTEEERDAIQLDIRAAVNYISSQKNVDDNRVAIFAANELAEYAVKEAAINKSQIKALVLSTSKLTDIGRESLKKRKKLPVLAFASHDDPRNLQATAAEPFFLTEASGSRLIFVVDRGASIFNRPGNPAEKTLAWLRDNFQLLGLQTKVSFKTEDGKTLHGVLYKPYGIENDQQFPGVVYIHGANHDSTTWIELVQEATKAGISSLIFDQRGYRSSLRSTSKDSRRVNIDLDIQAAINFLASQPWVDSERIGLITSTSRAGPAVAVAHADRRIMSIVALSFYGANENTKQYLGELDIPIFLAASINDKNADGGSLEDGTLEAYRHSRHKESSLIMYDGAGRGSSMLKTRPELTGLIVRWFNNQLSRR